MFVHQGRELEQSQLLQQPELGHRLVLHSRTGGLAGQALLAAPVLLLARSAGGGEATKMGGNKLTRRENVREVCMRTHLLRWERVTFPVPPSTSASSSEHCTSRWTWVGEEGQGEAAEEPGESWDEEEEEEEPV